MARIRSIKPEFWADRKLARVSRDARLLYIALWNLADEHGRLQGDARWIKGHVFPYDDDIGEAEVWSMLAELAALGCVHPYTVDCDPFLFLPKLAGHQRLEPGKSSSRLPEPPPEPEPIVVPATVLPEPAQIFPDRPAPIVVQQVAGSREHDAGSREHGAWVPPTAARESNGAANLGTTQTIVGEWIDHCPKRPPEQIIKRVGRSVTGLLAEGIDPDDIRRGMAQWQAKGRDPSTLPSVVNEVMNAQPRASPRQDATNAQFDRQMDRALRETK